MLRRHAAWAVRDRFPHRKVVRDVQGVRLVLPWSHRLPDYAGDGSQYGQNLVRLAAELGTGESPLTVLDIGANVGDSTRQILHAVDARVLCVEGDPAYLEYLHLNCDADPRVTIVEALLATAEATPTRAVRSGGTTRFETGGPAGGFPVVTAAGLRETHPDFARLRLVKSDTDGHDVALVPLVAQTWRDDPPVLFFEYDHRLSRTAGHDPLAVWPQLAALGYRSVAAWDNGGVPLGHTTVDEIGALAAVLDVPVGRRAQHYWDVALAHEADQAGLAALRRLVPDPLVAPR
jgi:FkbM family methyltransferase